MINQVENKKSCEMCKHYGEDEVILCKTCRSYIGFELPNRQVKSQEDEFTGWLCTCCGHLEESELHCSCCGEEPPWGCDCDFCQNLEPDDYEDNFGW